MKLNYWLKFKLKTQTMGWELRKANTHSSLLLVARQKEVGKHIEDLMLFTVVAHAHLNKIVAVTLVRHLLVQAAKKGSSNHRLALIWRCILRVQNTECLTSILHSLPPLYVTSMMKILDC